MFDPLPTALMLDSLPELALPLWGLGRAAVGGMLAVLALVVVAAQAAPKPEASRPRAERVEERYELIRRAG